MFCNTVARMPCNPMYLHRASCAVNLFLGSRFNIFLTKSLALLDILGQGSDEKSRSPFRICSNIPCSDSTKAEQCPERKNRVDNSQNKKGKVKKCSKKGRYILTIPKWRDPTQQDINYYTGTPHIHLASIVFHQNLRCNIVWTSNDI
jgi:hypothetical protein